MTFLGTCISCIYWTWGQCKKWWQHDQRQCYSLMWAVSFGLVRNQVLNHSCPLWTLAMFPIWRCPTYSWCRLTAGGSIVDDTHSRHGEYWLRKPQCSKENINLFSILYSPFSYIPDIYSWFDAINFVTKESGFFKVIRLISLLVV